MNDQQTQRLGLSLVQGAQAQKHVTVNESFARLDGLVNLVLRSINLATPPVSALDGTCFGVPAGAEGDWGGQEGKIAIAANGGWVFADAEAGMRAFILDSGTQAVHDGISWVEGALTLGRFGSALVARTAETEFTITAGTNLSSDLYIPTSAMVIGATARVVDEISGTLTSWMLGTEGAADRFGSTLGIQKGSWARGMLSQPFTYWSPTPVILTAAGGEFGTGKVRLAVHWLELTLPS